VTFSGDYVRTNFIVIAICPGSQDGCDLENGWLNISRALHQSTSGENFSAGFKTKISNATVRFYLPL
jgi:hypothetical protein